ncbi:MULTISPECIES: BlaI/MecI/CopY family transcriptional regulator [unclassified Clostridioides]|uniref:BlaI/MecI/CopY family transcriptional regulator n=1 Tax=unclassified Clostridioides TaxID=2635829 RepID=UPI001D10DC62|nr:BlaI/MecI/CopY family transcriptional regulator [Clostridioides sp. ES-S-0171-01]MCC0686670.1 BlaI/MecI/CopY family transcriptional regulator [Clostridioides sp. ES-S-0056-01]MCC0713813.1 BlaI/MecI/CopY family transcriptional regulator [Clostridioides sp. ES-S-0077-01]UDN55249.1 BlaI/MecI/CopY family transcriptional regulator [Clostridioides sp. ES-S-0054-01]
MIQKIPEAELKIMKFIWKINKTVSSKEVVASMEQQFDWKQTTTLTLLSRLVKRKFLNAEKIKRFTYYTAIIGEIEYQIFETKNFFKRIHNDSAESMMVSLYAGNILSKETFESFKESFSSTEDDE